MEEQKRPVLNLKIEKGPLSGQDLQFKPGTQIHIGRVKSGNTIAIKDPGISSKHLSITFDDSASGSWVIHDLGSSNGTFLNTVLIDPSRPVKLSDGDVVKIGELTSIKVEISAAGVELVGEIEAKCKNTRRNPRRKAGANENWELGFGKGEIENVDSKRTTRSYKSVKNEEIVAVEVPRRTRGNKKAESVQNAVGSLEETENPAIVGVEIEKKPSPRRTRGARKVASKKNGDGRVEEAENIAVVDEEVQRKPIPRRTRGARKLESAKNGDDAEETVNVAVVDEEGDRKPSPRRTRGARKAKNVITEAGNLVEPNSFAAVDVEKEKKVCSRRTRGSRKEEDVENPDENVGECVELGKGKSTARRVCLEEDGAMENLERDQEAVENYADEGVERNMPEEVAVKSGREGCEASTSNAGINMSGIQVEEEVDLEKMTLGEWLDYLEVALPKQIIDATDEMILAMNQKTERFQEFMKQQKNAKGIDGIPKG